MASSTRPARTAEATARRRPVTSSHQMVTPGVSLTAVMAAATTPLATSDPRAANRHMAISPRSRNESMFPTPIS